MIEDKIQAVADLRQPIRDDPTFYDGANMGDLIQAAMQGESVKEALGELSGRFIEKHQGAVLPAVGMGREIAKAIHEAH